nr:hypothetical protein [Tanacetum cinerariifolium]
MTPKKRTTRSSPTTTTTTTTLVTDAQLKALIDQGVADALATCDTDRSRNSKYNHNSGAGVRRQAPLARECTYPDFMKCIPLYFKGTKGVVELTQWNQGHYRSDFSELKKQNHRNQVEGTGSRGMVHALGGGETNQDLYNIYDDINA